MNGKDRKEGLAILRSDKIDSKTKAIKKDKEGHGLRTKGSFQEENIICISSYAPDIGAPQSQLMVMPDSEPTEQSQGWILHLGDPRPKSPFKDNFHRHHSHP